VTVSELEEKFAVGAVRASQLTYRALPFERKVWKLKIGEIVTGNARQRRAGRRGPELGPRLGQQKNCEQERGIEAIRVGADQVQIQGRVSAEEGLVSFGCYGPLAPGGDKDISRLNREGACDARAIARGQVAAITCEVPYLDEADGVCARLFRRNTAVDRRDFGQSDHGATLSCHLQTSREIALEDASY
jgi:hypothetical protein